MFSSTNYDISVSSFGLHVLLVINFSVLFFLTYYIHHLLPILHLCTCAL